MEVVLKNSIDGKKAKLTNNSELAVFAVTETEEKAELRRGGSFNINTGEVTLTTASESAVAYIANNGSEKLILSASIIGLGASTGGTAGVPAKVRFYRNPTGGTIVSGATSMDFGADNKARNKNFGSTKTLVLDNYKGAEGNTVTGSDGTVALVHAYDSQRTVIPELDFELQTGNTLAVSIEPPTGNTSIDVYVAFVAYIAEDLFE